MLGPMNAFRVLPALLLLTAPLLATTALAGDCSDGRSGYAAFGSASAGGVVLNSQAGNFSIPSRQTQIAFGGSTTGTMNVDVVHSCVVSYRLVVEQTGGTSPGVVYDQTVLTGCGSGTDTHGVPIDLNAGSYSMTLTWIGCDGTSGKDKRDWVICDPPTPIPYLR